MATVVVCIPTMGRFAYLQRSVPKYLQMDSCVKGVVICDETGEDVAAIRAENWGAHPKLHLFANRERLGPYENKTECVRRAAALWGDNVLVALIDSDNFAPEETYFKPMLQVARDANVVYAPGWSEWKGERTVFSHFKTLDASNVGTAVRRFKMTFVVLNTGNFVVAAKTYLQPCESMPAVDRALAADKFNFASDAAAKCLHMLANGATIVVVPNAGYEHSQHATSLFATHGETRQGRINTGILLEQAMQLETRTNRPRAWLPAPRALGNRDL